MPAHILVVDDEPDLELLIKQRFRRQNVHSIDIVLTDINMPEMDGLSLIGHLKENFPLLKSVIISAYGDMKNIRTALNRGAFDFVTKPIDFSDLENTIERTLQEALAAKEAFEHRSQVLNMQKELEVAREIQQSILPQKFPAFPDRKDIDVYAKMFPARKVGGDLYDFFLIDEHRLGFCIGDVSGKGVPAALFMAVTKTLLKSIAFQIDDPGKCLKKVNNILQKDSVSSVFVTLFYGILDTKSGKLFYANGGHNPFYILSPNGDLKEIGPNGGIPVGFIADFAYPTSHIMLSADDILIFYTDGVNEAMDLEENEFSEQRLEKCISGLKNESAKDVIEKVFKNVSDFTQGVEQSDDITMLAVQFRNH